MDWHHLILEIDSKLLKSIQWLLNDCLTENYYLIMISPVLSTFWIFEGFRLFSDRLICLTENLPYLIGTFSAKSIYTGAERKVTRFSLWAAMLFTKSFLTVFLNFFPFLMYIRIILNMWWGESLYKVWGCKVITVSHAILFVIELGLLLPPLIC